jgi:hypothetical protein
MPQSVPEICGFDCPFADFPPADTTGICRTMSAVWCRKLEELTSKNIPCRWLAQKGRGTGVSRTSGRSRPTGRNTGRRPAGGRSGGRIPGGVRRGRRSAG